jgi:hypothetical protein
LREAAGAPAAAIAAVMTPLTAARSIVSSNHHHILKFRSILTLRCWPVAHLCNQERDLRDQWGNFIPFNFINGPQPRKGWINLRRTRNISSINRYRPAVPSLSHATATGAALLSKQEQQQGLAGGTSAPAAPAVEINPS